MGSDDENNETRKIGKFNAKIHESFDYWKIQMMSLLKLMGSWEIILGFEEEPTDRPEFEPLDPLPVTATAAARNDRNREEDRRIQAIKDFENEVKDYRKRKAKQLTR